MRPVVRIRRLEVCFLRRVGLALLALAVTSCGGSQSVAAPADKAELVPADFYPLKVGNVWSYDVDSGDETPTLAITKVERVDGSLVELRTNRAQAVRYELRPEGISAGDRVWLLRAPIRTGSEWQSRGGRVAMVGSTTETITTEAGTFSPCVRVHERGGELELDVTTVYCKDVGPVYVQSTMTTKRGSVSVTARLRGYSLVTE